MIKFIQKQMSKDGFTLVELIIVIAVMAILAAIVVPRMSGITDSFKVKADERYMETVAKQIKTEVQLGNLALVTNASPPVDIGYTNIAVYTSGGTLGTLGEYIASPQAKNATNYYIGYDATNIYVYTSSSSSTSAIPVKGTSGVLQVVTMTHGGVIK